MWREDVSGAIATSSSPSFSSFSQFFFLFFDVGGALSGSLLLVLEGRCCSADDSADALAHVEKMERNQAAVSETRRRAAFQRWCPDEFNRGF